MTYQIALNQMDTIVNYGLGSIDGTNVIIAKYLQGMNTSGKGVKHLLDLYKGKIIDVIIIYDDIELDISKCSLRLAAGSARHNGIKSVINELGSKDFRRIRVGIGKPGYKTNLLSYVLDVPTDLECIKLRRGIEQVTTILTNYFKSNKKL